MTKDFREFPPEVLARRAAARTQQLGRKPAMVTPEIPSSNQLDTSPSYFTKKKLEQESTAIRSQSTEIPQSVPSVVEKNADYIQLDLPSNFIFYEFKSLAARKIRGGEQAKINRSSREQSMLHLVEAISATLEPGVSAFDLTVPDFYWLLYWHRQNSYTKNTYVHTTFCTNPDHVEKVLEGQLPEESLRIEEFIKATTLKETKLEEPPQTDDLENLNSLGLEIHPCTMRDLVDMLEAGDIADPEMEFLYNLASHIKPIGEHKDLKVRIAMVQNMEADCTEELNQYMARVLNYGVEESINVRCKECGAEKVSEITIDARTFLPSPR